ncbi:MAG: hypothetical protein AAGJ83_03815 [Planctomycetota bacterium]
MTNPLARLVKPGVIGLRHAEGDCQPETHPEQTGKTDPADSASASEGSEDNGHDGWE